VAPHRRAATAAARAGPAGGYDTPRTYCERPRFLPPTLGARLRAALEAEGGEPASVQATPGAALRVDEQVRRVWEIELPDRLQEEVVARLRALHGTLERHFSVRLAPCDAVAALRYPRGAFYRTHRDASQTPDRHGLHRRAVSIVIFVNSGHPNAAASFTGGQLWLHDVADAAGGICAITPVAGALVAFRSSQLHEVRPVKTGLRLTLVSWLLDSDEPGAAGSDHRTGHAVSKRR
jgi:predicted 2-oxoglutarate/Fe(II)-dependent dioxygenase YbiX